MTAFIAPPPRHVDVPAVLSALAARGGADSFPEEWEGEDYGWNTLGQAEAAGLIAIRVLGAAGAHVSLRLTRAGYAAIGLAPPAWWRRLLARALGPPRSSAG